MRKLNWKANWVRYAVLMALGVLMNIAFHELAVWLNLPMWLDYSGTALCAAVLEPTAGLLVGLVNNFLLAIEANSPELIIYYAVSASIALIVGLGMRKHGKLSLARIPLTAVLLVLICSVLSTALTFWRSAGVTNSYWEALFCGRLVALGLPYWLSLFGGVAWVKVYGVATTIVIDLLVYLALPKWLKFGWERETAA